MYCKYNTYENTITKKGKGSKVTKFQIVFFYTYMYTCTCICTVDIIMLVYWLYNVT